MEGMLRLHVRPHASTIGAAAITLLLVIDAYVPVLAKAYSDALRLIIPALLTSLAAAHAFRLYGQLRVENPMRASAWRLIGLAAVTGLLLQGILAGRRLLPNSEVLPEVMEATSVLFAAGGLALLAFSWPIAGKFRVILDSAIATSSVVVLSWYFVLSTLWSSAGDNPAARLGVLASPVAATVLVFLAVVVFIAAAGNRRLSPAIFFVTLGGITLGLGGIAVHVRDLPFLDPQKIALPLTTIGWFLAAVAAKVWRCREEAEQDRRKAIAGPTSPLSALGPYAVAMLAFGSVCVQELQSRGAISGAIFVLSGFLMSLVVVRQLLTLHENQTLTKRVSAFNQDLERVVQTRTSQINSLYSFSKAIGNSIDLESVIKAAREHTGAAFGTDRVVLNLVPFAFNTSANTKPLVRVQGLDGKGWVLDALNVLEVQPAGSFGTLHAPRFQDLMRYVIAPVVYQGKVYGWIAAFRSSEPFDKDDIAVIEGLGVEIGTGLENARLYELARQMADVDSVSGLLNHRAAQQRFDFAFQYAKEQSQPLAILLLDIDNFKHYNDTYGHLAGDQVLKTIARVLRDAVRPHDVPARYGGDEFLVVLPQTNAEEAAELAKKISTKVAEEGFAEPDTDRVIPIAVSIGYAAFPEEATTRHDLLLQADKQMYHAKRAAHGSSPLSARLVIARAPSLEGFDLMDSMITAVDNKDYYTRAHSEEVTEYALWMAQELRLSEEAQRTIRLAGLLHDVGKIGIPDEVLSKPGKLSDTEMDVMRQHPELGAFMVSNIPGLADIVPGVRHHHEKWDGTGYPHGLAGEAIPYLARLLAVPDVFSALTTERPYRKGMDWSKALELIREGSGSHFDPKMVEAFERAIARRRSNANSQAA